MSFSAMGLAAINLTGLNLMGRLPIYPLSVGQTKVNLSVVILINQSSLDYFDVYLLAIIRSTMSPAAVIWSPWILLSDPHGETLI